MKEMEIQLKVATAERQHAEAILYSISDAVLVTDPFDELVLANESAAKTFAFDLAKSSPRSDRPGAARHEDDRADPGDAAKQQPQRRIVEHDVHTPGGDRSYKITLSCVASAAEQAGGVVAVLHDMTREKEVAEMKNDFVSNVSHELRTPLASIKAYVEMLIDGEAERREDQARVLRSDSERGQSAGPADRQHSEHLAASSRGW